MTYLLDVNVLVALTWAPHVHHAAAVKWLGGHLHGWATNPLTEAGFVRVLSTPAVTGGAVTTQRAIEALDLTCNSARHEFWPLDRPFAETVAHVCEPLQGPRQVSDAYLLGAAVQRGGMVATFDQGLPALVSAGIDRKLVEIIPADAKA